MDLQQILQAYSEFKLCRELGCLPHQLEEVPAYTVHLWQMMLAAENEAEQYLIDHPKKGR